MTDVRNGVPIVLHVVDYRLILYDCEDLKKCFSTEGSVVENALLSLKRRPIGGAQIETPRGYSRRLSLDLSALRTQSPPAAVWCTQGLSGSQSACITRDRPISKGCSEFSRIYPSALFRYENKIVQEPDDEKLLSRRALFNCRQLTDDRNILNILKRDEHESRLGGPVRMRMWTDSRTRAAGPGVAVHRS
ncbi:hypothetical protein EVAR_38597_1 [Eumeta japonica]|uniref:Uncharacterized protein n=1 Tax=Eumeta variegata TaxID=151549 RepID=A0A4C1WU20_EUMVA|nr:hypothetical protein EVAR_38597_1 [Eumeta japonica]